MFGGFEKKTDAESKKRFVVSTSASISVYATIGAVLVLVARDPRTAEAAKEIGVVFRPPPPPVAVIAPAPAPVAPQKPAAKKVITPSAPKPLVAPEVVPDKKLEESEPVEAVIEGGEGGATGDGFGPPSAKNETPPAPPPPPPPAAPKKKEPINLPEAATPPAPADDNTAPEYPGDAREKGLEGLVILKVVITETGEVSKIQVLRGEEPFVAAALAAVKTWRYSPAIVEGQPMPVFRILKIPFRLKS